MPKIPEYVASQGVPLAPGPEMRADIAALPASTAAAGFHHTEIYSVEAMRHIMAMNAEEKRQTQVSDAYQSLLVGAKRRAELETLLREGQSDEDGTTVVPPANSKDYFTRHTQGMETIGQNIAGGITDPAVRNIFMRGWDRESAGAAIQASHYRRQLFQGEQTAEVTQQYHAAIQSVADATDPAEAQIRADLFRVYLGSKANAIAGGAARAETIRQSFDKEIYAHEARQAIRAGTFLEEDYKGKLDSGTLDTLVVKNDAFMAHAQKAYVQSMKDWAESVQRETSKLITTGKLSQEWLDDYKYAFTGEQLQAYGEVLRQQQLGRHTLGSNAAVARDHESMVANRTNLSINPEKELGRLTQDFNKGLIGGDIFIPYSSLWSTEIERRRNDGKATNNQEETEIRRLQEHRYRTAVNEVETLFRPTEKLVNFEAVLTLNKNLFLGELNKRAQYTGGTEDPQAIVREMLPKYLAPVGERLREYVTTLQSQINYDSVKQLIDAKQSIGEVEFKRQLGYMKQVKDIQDELGRYEKRQNRSFTPPTTGTP